LHAGTNTVAGGDALRACPRYIPGPKGQVTWCCQVGGAKLPKNKSSVQFIAHGMMMLLIFPNISYYVFEYLLTSFLIF